MRRRKSEVRFARTRICTPHDVAMRSQSLTSRSRIFLRSSRGGAVCVRGCAGVGVGVRERLRACVAKKGMCARGMCVCVCACMFVYL